MSAFHDILKWLAFDVREAFPRLCFNCTPQDIRKVILDLFARLVNSIEQMVTNLLVVFQCQFLGHGNFPLIVVGLTQQCVSQVCLPHSAISQPATSQ